jgi:type IV pilus assembly protein PilQ
MFNMRSLTITYLLSIFLTIPAAGQKKLPQEYVAPDEIITLSSTMSFEQAFNVLSKIAERKEGKTIIDPLRRKGLIDVEIVNLPWKKAFEVLLKANRLSYVEHEKYYEIVGEPQKESPEEEPPKLNSREIRIEAIFFEGDKEALLEAGIDWSVFTQWGPKLVDRRYPEDPALWKFNEGSFGVGGGTEVADDIVEGGGQYVSTIRGTDVTVSSMLRTFEKEDLGKILAQPQVVVLSGKEGRIQVGQDFSIKTLDFAGNIIDQFFSVGTILTVKPTVYTENEVDFIHMIIEMERSDVTPDPVSTIVNKSEATTEVLLLNGETTMLGGMYSRDTRELHKGIPLLKDLPWWFLGLRYLFGYTLDKVYDRELIVILRASIIPRLEDRINIVPGTLDEVFRRGAQEMDKSFERNWKAKSDTTTGQ